MSDHAACYTVISPEDKIYPLEVLAQGFLAMEGMTWVEAQTMARRVSTRLLARRVREDDARAMVDAFQQLGVQVQVIDEREMPQLPPPILVRRHECAQEGFVTFDLMGRPITHPWDEILLVALGRVEVEETQRVVKRVYPKQGVHPVDLLHPGFGGMAGANEFYRDETSTETVKVSHVYLEIYCGAGDDMKRLQLDLDELPLKVSYEADARIVTRAHLFNTLAQTVIERAGHALLNKGAIQFCSDPSQYLRYPSMQSFEDEILWLLVKDRLS